MMGQYVTLHGEVISHVNLSRTEVGDGGLYTCTASNRAGSAAHSARLNIYGECRHCYSLVIVSYTFINRYSRDINSIDIHNYRYTV